jgi:DNA-binding HxlR family transcriptional regulator
LLDRIADKWALLSIATLHTQRLGFTELQQRIAGIPRRMLTLTLRKLERDGLVIRTAHAEVPAPVEYEPSELAATLNNVWTGSAGPLVTSPSEAP